MKPSARVIVACLLLGGALLVLQLRSTGEAVPMRKTFDTFPTAVGIWQGRQATNLEVEVLISL